MMRVFVQSVGLLGPGLPNWAQGRAVFTGDVPYQEAAMPKPVPEILPATERRRSSDAVRLAVAVAEEAVNAGAIPRDALATVFSSSDGDGSTTHKICEALATQARELSPTLFHNSVFNAPAGYWGIGAGSRMPSTSLCGYDHSFSIGLLEAAMQVTVDQHPVLFIAYDLPLPPPLHALRPVAQGLAVALLLTPRKGPDSLMEWLISIEHGPAPSALPKTLPGRLSGNPAARGLPLLEAVARHTAGTIWLEYLTGRTLEVRCRP